MTGGGHGGVVGMAQLLGRRCRAGRQQVTQTGGRPETSRKELSVVGVGKQPVNGGAGEGGWLPVLWDPDPGGSGLVTRGLGNGQLEEAGQAQSPATGSFLRPSTQLCTACWDAEDSQQHLQQG